MVDKICKGLGKFIEINSLIGGIFMIGLMVFITIDVIMRYLSRSITGSQEVIVNIIVLIVFLAIAWCGVQDAHIKIDVFTKWPNMNHATNLIMIVLFFLACYSTVQQTAHAYNLHIVSTMLDIPRWVFLAVTAYGMLLAGLSVCILEMRFIMRQLAEKATGNKPVGEVRP